MSSPAQAVVVEEQASSYKFSTLEQEKINTLYLRRNAVEKDAISKAQFTFELFSKGFKAMEASINPKAYKAFTEQSGRWPEKAEAIRKHLHLPLAKLDHGYEY